MIIVTHEIAFAREVADQIVFMEGGMVVESGTPQEVLVHPREERTRAFLNRYWAGRRCVMAQEFEKGGKCL